MNFFIPSAKLACVAPQRSTANGDRAQSIAGRRTCRVPRTPASKQQLRPVNGLVRRTINRHCHRTVEMASRIQPKDATLTTTSVACLVAAVAWILINSIYVGSTEGWPQFVLSVFAAITVVGLGLATLAYAAHQQLVLKNSLFVDHDHSGKEFDYRPTGQWAVVKSATEDIGKEKAQQVSNQGSNSSAQEDVTD